MTDIQMYLVGGAVRDKLLGLPVKDFDYTLVVDPTLGLTIEEAYAFMKEYLTDLGFKIFLDTPEYLTIRARFPKGHENEKITADFVLARKDGPYSDNRRPDWVKPGSLYDDLARRDFTVNAMAETTRGNIIDFFQGQMDLNILHLRAVGDPEDRLSEDPLRAYRAIRFSITKGFAIGKELKNAINTVRVLDGMENVSVERIREELYRAFAHDTVATISLLWSHYPMLMGIMERKGIWLKPTLEQR